MGESKVIVLCLWAGERSDQTADGMKGTTRMGQKIKKLTRSMARIELASKEILDLRFGDRTGKDQRTLKHCREVNAEEINAGNQRCGPSAEDTGD